jgi:hypothetical protein
LENIALETALVATVAKGASAHHVQLAVREKCVLSIA